MSGRASVLGFFGDLAALTEAVRRLRRAGYADLETISPFMSRETGEALGWRESKIQTFTLVGGLLGGGAGFALTIFTSLDIGLITGGQPLVSLPPFAVIAFELTILLGVAGTLVGFLWYAGLPRIGTARTRDPRCLQDRFGLAVNCPPESVPDVHILLQGCSVEEVHIEME
ncbi:MAG: DUF3341 domain-containing protein [Candidatus Binatia bacterium]